MTEVPRSGWAVSNQQNVTVALDITITPELRRAGLARETIRLVQTARKTAKPRRHRPHLAVVAATNETADAIREHERELSDAVLAIKITEHSLSDLPADDHAFDTGPIEDDELGVHFWLSRADTDNGQ